MSGKLFIKTYGCQMNEYDTAKMADLLRESHGLELTDQPERADVLLLNTCSIREKAQEKVFSQLGRWRPWKERHPQLVIGVGGCVASQEGEAIRERAPYVDLVFGPQTLHRLPQMLDESRRRNAPVVDVSFPEIEKFDRLPEPRAEGPTAFVSIMEGCSKYCTYCVVPYTRGEEISRPFDDVIAEVAKLAAQGVREVNLLGQNVNAFRGQMHDGGAADLAFGSQLTEFLAQAMCRTRWAGGSVATGIARRAQSNLFRGDAQMIQQRLQVDSCAAGKSVPTRVMRDLTASIDRTPGPGN